MVFLLMQGADPNKTNANGTTPLMFAKTAAFTYGDCEGMRILLEAGADKNARDKSGLTALEYTVRNAGMVREFLEKY
jgi:ankyrin repeat protein